MSILWWLYCRKNVMPWEYYTQPQGYRDLVNAFTLIELELRRE